MDVKNIFKKINNYDINIGIGGSKKSHMISPLDLILSSYIMAMFKFNFKLISQLNTFNCICKSRYLPYTNTSRYKKPN